MREKGRLKKWLKDNGRNALGNVLDTIGENTSIPIASKLIEGIGESLMDDKEISEDDMFKSQEDVQKITDGYITKVDKMTKVKEAEILEI